MPLTFKVEFLSGKIEFSAKFKKFKYVEVNLATDVFLAKNERFIIFMIEVLDFVNTILNQSFFINK